MVRGGLDLLRSGANRHPKPSVVLARPCTRQIIRMFGASSKPSDNLRRGLRMRTFAQGIEKDATIWARAGFGSRRAVRRLVFQAVVELDPWPSCAHPAASTPMGKIYRPEGNPVS